MFKRFWLSGCKESLLSLGKSIILSIVTWWESIVLGVVQGLTEFFPVSSDGHLAVADHLLGLSEPNLLFDVMLHFGTLGSLFVVYWKDIQQLLARTLDGFLGIKKAGLKEGILAFDRWTLFVWITTFVTGLVGIIVEKQIEFLSASILAAGIGFLITSGVLFAANVNGRGESRVEHKSWWFPLLIGLAQSAALLPGVSRSGSTICLALLLGVKREEAGRYSFVAAIPIIFMASLYEMRKLPGQDFSELGVMSLGVMASFVTGFFAIRLLLLMLTKLALWPFALYTFVIGLLSIGVYYGWV